MKTGYPKAPHSQGARSPGSRSQGAGFQGSRSQGSHSQGSPSRGGFSKGPRPESDEARPARSGPPRGQFAKGDRFRPKPAYAPQAEEQPRAPVADIPDYEAPMPEPIAREHEAEDTQHQRPDRERQHSGGHNTRHPGAQARRVPAAPRGTVWLYGFHAVAAALTNTARRLRRLVVTSEAEATLARECPRPWSVSPEQVDRPTIDRLLGQDVVHQGVALLADVLAPPSLQSALERDGPIIVLDQVTDPRNVGAIMRSAAAFGAAAVITQDRNAPEENGALAKAASGALETIPLLRAVNIARTLVALKAADVWCVGLDASGPALSGAAFAGRRVALVLGAEGEGMRRLTKETCDEVAGLPIKGGIESLNVSAAASVALYELGRTG